MSKKILILGAGRSSGAVIEYLAKTQTEFGWEVTVADQSEEPVRKAIEGMSGIRVLALDTTDQEKLQETIKGKDAVVSLLPAHLHSKVATHCLTAGAYLITASYVSDEMKNLHQQAEEKGLLFLNECGLDPGIDHMSAMEVIDRIRKDGGKITAFRSFTGGLIAPQTDLDNPWRYKFTWNARNVVMAGQGTAIYREDGKLKRIPYQQLFTRTVPIMVPGTGVFDGYANRDSLKYIETYGLNDVKTMLRGTLRYRGYCQAWNILVQMGCCEDQGELNVENLSHSDFIEFFLPGGNDSLEMRVATRFNLQTTSPEIKLLNWSGLFSSESIGLKKGTPAQILEHILNKKWKLQSGDLDQIVMWHQFIYQQDGREHEIQSSLVSEGLPGGHTAMARTVGLPMGIATRLILENKIALRGVQIPVKAQIYEPILKELATMGIVMQEVKVR
jgi:saccharopine dehydrogenase (NADP+, L-glutamate forming)